MKNLWVMEDRVKSPEQSASADHRQMLQSPFHGSDYENNEKVAFSILIPMETWNAIVASCVAFPQLCSPF